jgi:L-alanine-DL-glutamate epimerase-like enolase superfamily enzyme
MVGSPGNIVIEVRQLAIPLTMPVTQASSSRAVTSSLWAVARRRDHVGVGEGCPRPYVTGETLEGAFDWCQKTASQLSSVGDLENLVASASEMSDDIDRNPAAWCTIELAILDLLARECGCSVEELLGIPTATTTFTYTAVVDDSSEAQFDTLKQLYSQAGFSDYKLKVNGDRVVDARRIQELAAVGAAKVRLDANNYWGSDTERAIRDLQSIEGWWAVEEPLLPGMADEMSQLAQTLDRSVILDESLTATGDVDRFSALPGNWVANVKVSKSGGMLRSLAIIDAATAAGWPVIIGAQVGETSVLTRAGIAAARAAGSQLRAIEGGFGTWLLTEDPATPTVMWGEEGVLDLNSLAVGADGWGLTSLETT